MRLLVEIDLSQAEWVVTGFAAQELRMIEVFEKQIDPHVYTGKLISGAPEEFIKWESDLLDHATDPSEIRDLRMNNFPTWEVENGPVKEEWFLPRSMSIRQAGKKSNHGLNYRLKYKNFALYNEIEETEANKIVNAYRRRAYPRLEQWYGEIDAKLKKDRTLFNCFGRKRVFRKPFGDELSREATAFIPQSTVADVTMIGLVGIYNDGWKWIKRCVDILCQVHDSILFQIQFDSWDQLASIIKRLIRHMSEPCIYHNREFVLRTDVAIGTEWGGEKMVKVKRTGNLPVDLYKAWEKIANDEDA